MCESMPLAKPAMDDPAQSNRHQFAHQRWGSLVFVRQVRVELERHNAGITTSSGRRIFMNPAKITPMPIPFAPGARHRCTMNWLVQLYQMPIEMKSVHTPNHG